MLGLLSLTLGADGRFYSLLAYVQTEYVFKTIDGRRRVTPQKLVVEEATPSFLPYLCMCVVSPACRDKSARSP